LHRHHRLQLFHHHYLVVDLQKEYFLILLLVVMLNPHRQILLDHRHLLVHNYLIQDLHLQML
jgi:hypothetical protein